MKIQIIIHYLKSGQEASPGVRVSDWAVKAAVPIMRPSWERLNDMPTGFFYALCCKSVGTFDSLTDFNSRSTLWNGTLINPEDISSSLPVVLHYTGIESIISWSQKTWRSKCPANSKVHEYLSFMVYGRVLFLFFDWWGHGVNGIFREDKIKLNSISLSLN